MKYFIALLMALSILSISGCGNKQDYGSSGAFDMDDDSQVNISSNVTSSALETSMIENKALISFGLKEALTYDVMVCVKTYVNYPPDADLSAETVETFKHVDSLTYLYIVPRYSGSYITIEGMAFEESRNEFVTTGILFESVCMDDYALLVQADLPEAVPRLRVTITYKDITTSYTPAYDGRGDTVYPYVKNGVLLDEAPFSEDIAPVASELPEYVIKYLNDMKRQLENNDAEGFAASASAALSDAMQYAPFSREYYEFISGIDVTVYLDFGKIRMYENYATTTVDLEVRNGNGVFVEGKQTASLLIGKMGITQFMISTNGNFVYYIHRDPPIMLNKIQIDMCDTAESIINAFSPRSINLHVSDLSDDEKRMLILSVFYKSGEEFTAPELEKYAEERFGVKGLDPTDMVKPGFQFSFDEATNIYYLPGTEPRCRAVYSMFFMPAGKDDEEVLRVCSYKEALCLAPDKTLDFHFKIITDENTEYARLVSVQVLDE